MYANIYLYTLKTTILLGKKLDTLTPHDSGQWEKNAELKRKTENMLKHDLRIMPAES